MKKIVLLLNTLLLISYSYTAEKRLASASTSSSTASSATLALQQRSALSMALQQQVEKVEESQRRLRILGQRRAELANQDQEPQEIRVKRILEKLTREAQGIKELQDRNGGTGDGD